MLYINGTVSNLMRGFVTVITLKNGKLPIFLDILLRLLYCTFYSLKYQNSLKSSIYLHIQRIAMTEWIVSIMSSTHHSLPIDKRPNRASSGTVIGNWTTIGVARQVNQFGTVVGFVVLGSNNQEFGVLCWRFFVSNVWKKWGWFSLFIIHFIQLFKLTYKI